MQPVKGAFGMIANAVVTLHSPEMAGDLVVSTPLLFTSRWMARHIGEFLEHYPGINLAIEAQQTFCSTQVRHFDCGPE